MNERGGGGIFNCWSVVVVCLYLEVSERGGAEPGRSVYMGVIVAT